MKPAAVKPAINGHRVLVEIDTVTGVVSLHFKIVQQFPLVQIMRAGLLWDEATERFVLTSGKKPSRDVTMADLRTGASELRSETEQTSPSHIFWVNK